MDKNEVKTITPEDVLKLMEDIETDRRITNYQSRWIELKEILSALSPTEKKSE